MRRLVWVGLLLGAFFGAGPVPMSRAQTAGDETAEPPPALAAVLDALDRPEPDFVTSELEALAEGGNAFARHTLGMMYLRGVGVARDRCTALDWFERAVELGHPPALAMIGKHHELGLCTALDFDKAAEYYRRTAARNAPEARLLLAWLYMNPEWASRNYRVAYAWAEGALETASTPLERDERRALIGLFYFAYGDGNPVVRDLEKAEALLRPAAERGFAWAQFLLAIAAGAVNPDPPYRESKIWFQLVADQGSLLVRGSDERLPDVEERIAVETAAREKLREIAADPESALAAGARWCRRRHPDSYDCLRFVRDAQRHCALGLPESQVEARFERTRLYDQCRTELHEYSSTNSRPWPNPEFTD